MARRGADLQRRMRTRRGHRQRLDLAKHVGRDAERLQIGSSSGVMLMSPAPARRPSCRRRDRRVARRPPWPCARISCSRSDGSCGMRSHCGQARQLGGLVRRHFQQVGPGPLVALVHAVADLHVRVHLAAFASDDRVDGQVVVGNCPQVADVRQETLGILQAAAISGMAWSNSTAVARSIRRPSRGPSRGPRAWSRPPLGLGPSVLVGSFDSQRSRSFCILRWMSVTLLSSAVPGTPRPRCRWPCSAAARAGSSTGG